MQKIICYKFLVLAQTIKGGSIFQKFLKFKINFCLLVISFLKQFGKVALCFLCIWLLSHWNPKIGFTAWILRPITKKICFVAQTWLAVCARNLDTLKSKQFHVVRHTLWKQCWIQRVKRPWKLFPAIYTSFIAKTFA